MGEFGRFHREKGSAIPILMMYPNELGDFSPWRWIFNGCADCGAAFPTVRLYGGSLRLMGLGGVKDSSSLVVDIAYKRPMDALNLESMIS